MTDETPDGRPTKAEVEALGRAMRIDWRGSEDRRLLRKAFRYLRTQMEQHIVANWGILAASEQLNFSPRRAADDLFDLLLELDALDLIGVAQLIRTGEQKAVSAARRKNRRREPKPPSGTPPAPTG